MLDPNAAVKQTSRAIAGKDTSFIGSIHGLKGSQNLATHSSMLQSAPQSVAGDQVKSLLEVHKTAVKILLCLLHQRLIRSPDPF